MPQGFGVVTLHRPSNVDSPDALGEALAILRDVARACRSCGRCIRARARISSASASDPMLDGSRIALLPNRRAISRCWACSRMRALVLTDSGGIQEETTALSVPCLTMRDNTERPITVDQGTNTLVGRDRAYVGACVDDILRTGGKRGRMPELWDGHAAERIAAHLATWLAARSAIARASPSMSTLAAPSGVAPAAALAAPIVNALTIDVEDYFQVSAFAPHIRRSDWDSMRVPRRAQHRPHSRAARRRERERDILHAGLDRRALSGAGPAHRRRRSRAREPRLRSPARDASRARNEFLADIRLAKAMLEDIAGRDVQGYRAPSFSVGADESVGVRLHRRGRLSLQLQHLSDSPRSLRHARRAALRARGTARLARDSGRDGAAVALATGPRAAAAISGCCPTRCRAGRSGASTRIDRQAGDVLLPSVGTRSRPAARRRHRREDALSPLRQPAQHGSRGSRACCAIFAGSRVDRVFLERRRVMEAATMRAARRRGIGCDRRSCACRLRAATSARWDAFRRALPATRRSFIARAGATSSRTSFATACHYLLAERDGAIVRRAAARGSQEPPVRPLRSCRCRFASMAARAADDADADDALIDAAVALAPVAARRASRAAQPRSECAPDWPRQDLYVTFRKALAPDVDANMLAIPRKQRAMVRKGIKHRARAARSTRRPSASFALYADNVHRHGTPPLLEALFRAAAARFSATRAKS